MAASPTASTPTSAGSPPPLAMKAQKENDNTHHSVNQAPSITTKEWIIPPRPKPGRKPATDTPPTKRKAQNRAAQRAFRERRAARVGELEECMKEVEDRHTEERDALKNNIARLESEVEKFRTDVFAWQDKCRELEQMVQNEIEGKRRAETDFAILQQKVSLKGNSVDSIFRKLSPRHNGPQGNGSNEDEAADLMGCGNCTPNSRCECVEKALNISPSASSGDNGTTPKRPHSPEESVKMKRHQSSRDVASIKPDPAELETDFTNLYSSSKLSISGTGEDSDANMNMNRPSKTNISPLPASEQCGFCQDGTPCVCAELENQASTTPPEENRLAPILSQFTPPPSEGDVLPSTISTISRPQPLHPSLRRPISGNPCANGPGTCDQCLSDPNSTIFCKSLASMRPLLPNGESSTNSTCCKSSTASTSGTCCRSTSQKQQAAPTLSCADAYTTLSRHPHYSEATEELEGWLGHLRTKEPSEKSKDRPPMEVEAASVMGVLKMFDRRFGRG
ncbi:MAG: hypothetical protein M1837_001444 [Sclerophora amabilis]|nr:MAG: hypothetical protein M1837_001444 [Sclerophora amabilis]